MQVENLENTSFFKAIKSYYPNNKLFLEAAINDWTICIPQSFSVNFEVKKSHIEDHILIPQPQQGFFCTKTKKRVEIYNTIIKTTNDFKIIRKISIINSIEAKIRDVETNKNNSFVKVLYISAPLEGGIEAPPSLDEIQRYNLNQYLAVLYGFPENGEIFSAILRNIDEIKKYLQSDRCSLTKLNPSLNNQILSQCEYFVKQFGQCPFLLSARRKGFNISTQILQSLESYYMNHIYDALYAELKREKSNELRKYRESIAFLRKKGIEYFNIRHQFHCDYSAAISAISNLSSLRTPLEKLQALVQFWDVVSDCLESHLSQKKIKVDTDDITTDDFLDIITYLLTISYSTTEYILIDILYITEYHFKSLDCSKAGQRLTNIEICINYILKISDKQEITVKDNIPPLDKESSFDEPYPLTMSFNSNRSPLKSSDSYIFNKIDSPLRKKPTDIASSLPIDEGRKSIYHSKIGAGYNFVNKCKLITPSPIPSQFKRIGSENTSLSSQNNKTNMIMNRSYSNKLNRKDKSLSNDFSIFH